MVLLASATLSAQSRILHVWVDPRYGNDSAAVAANPQTSDCAGQAHPHAVTDGTTDLLHAAAPFKTVTAAIAYIQSIHPTGLPVTHSATGVITEEVIIHCMPGLYGVGNGTDAHTGLQLNGETFPLLVPDRVSIQGTSILNTVFVGNTSNGVFAYGQAGNAYANNADPEIDDVPHQFLSHLAITGVIRSGFDYRGANPSTQQTEPEEGAAIWIDKERRTALLIANCVIYNNAIGLLVDDDPEDDEQNHLVVLTNNTFAWNVVGIWNGQVDRTQGAFQNFHASVGDSFLCLVNNIIDSSPPLNTGALEIPLNGTTANLPDSWARWVATLNVGNFNLLAANRLTGFEGVDADDVEALFPGSSTRFNFNGLEGSKWNISSTNVASAPPPLSSQEQMRYLGLHMTTERTARPALPSRSIHRYTGDNGISRSTRGILFVRDLLHEGGRSSGPFDMQGALASGDFDQGLGDWRLSPGCRSSASQTSLVPPTETNFCVDAGFTWQHDSIGNPIPCPMANGFGASPDVFTLGSEEASFPHDCNDWDGEGYGNLRVYDHPVYTTIATSVPSGIVVTTDLGADELDNLLMVGYREKTTFFMEPSATGTGNTENDFLFFLCASEGLPDGNGGSGTVPATQTNNLFPLFDAAFIPNGTWTLQPTATFYTPEYVDVTPHLLPDIHPWWFLLNSTLSASNINWLPCGSSSSLRNVTLYMAPTVGLINPPGSYVVFSSTFLPSFNWLDCDLWGLIGGSFTPSVFFTSTVTSTTSLFNANAWCFLEPASGAVLLQPSTSPSWGSASSGALRITCEWAKGSQPWADVPLDANRGANLQSFLVLK